LVRGGAGFARGVACLTAGGVGSGFGALVGAAPEKAVKLRASAAHAATERQVSAAAIRLPVHRRPDRSLAISILP
jgi:hypothetical protein